MDARENVDFSEEFGVKVLGRAAAAAAVEGLFSFRLERLAWHGMAWHGMGGGEWRASVVPKRLREASVRGIVTL